MEEHFHIRSKDNVLIVARYLPGFEADLTSWELTITDAGTLYQTLDTHFPVKKRAHRARVSINQDAIIGWLLRAEAIDFTVLNALEQSRCEDDSATYTLCFHYASLNKIATLRTLDGFVLEGEPTMTRLRILWDDIHAYAPFLHTRRPWAIKTTPI